MCYAFSDGITDAIYATCDFQDPTGRWLPHHSETDSVAILSPPAAKRRASSPMAREPAKKAKSIAGTEVDGDEVEIVGSSAVAAGEDVPEKLAEREPAEQANSVADDSAENDDVDIVSEKLFQLQRELAEEKSMTKRLTCELEEAESERNEYRLKAFDAEAEANELRTSQTSRGGDSLAQRKADSQKVEQSVKSKWQQKLQTQKEHFEERIEVLTEKHQDKLEELRERHSEQQKAKDVALGKKHQDINKRIEDNRAKCRQLVNDARTSEKKTKEDAAQAKKDLKAEQQEEIRKYKPETAAAVKEQKELVKTKQNEILGLQDHCGKLKCKIDEYKVALDVLEQQKHDLAEKVSKYRDKEDFLDGQLADVQGENELLCKNYAVERKAFDARCEEDGRKWQIQYNNAQEFMQKVIQHQRINFVLRNGNERRDRQIADQRDEISDLKTKLEGADAEVRRLSINVVPEQKSEADANMTEADAEFVNGHTGEGGELIDGPSGASDEVVSPDFSNGASGTSGDAAVAIGEGWMRADGQYDGA